MQMTQNTNQTHGARRQALCRARRADARTIPAGAGSERMMWLTLGLVALAIAFSAGGAAAQLSPGTGINDNSAFRERSRQQMESYQDRLRYGHDVGRDRALDTAERAQRERQRQLDRQEQIRRQRSQ